MPRGLVPDEHPRQRRAGPSVATPSQRLSPAPGGLVETVEEDRIQRLSWPRFRLQAGDRQCRRNGVSRPDRLEAGSFLAVLVAGRIANRVRRLWLRRRREDEARHADPHRHTHGKPVATIPMKEVTGIDWRKMHALGFRSAPLAALVLLVTVSAAAAAPPSTIRAPAAATGDKVPGAGSPHRRRRSRTMAANSPRAHRQVWCSRRLDRQSSFPRDMVLAVRHLRFVHRQA